MRKKRIREINLLPPSLRFDYKLYLAVRVFIAVAVVNLVVLVGIYVSGWYMNGKLYRCMKMRQAYLNNLKSLDSSLARYERMHRDLIKRLSDLKKEEEYLRHLIPVHESAFADTVIFVNTFVKGVYFRSVNYHEGVFNVEGVADSSLMFDVFYRLLENDPYVKYARFFYIKRKGDLYFFRVEIRVEY